MLEHMLLKNLRGTTWRLAGGGGAALHEQRIESVRIQSRRVNFMYVWHNAPMDNTQHTPVASSPLDPSGHWGQGRRLEFIDFRLRWEGRLNRSDLMEFFSISTPKASMDIGRYLELAPGNAFYDRSSRSYVAAEDFRPLFPDNNPERYLAELLARAAGTTPRELSFVGWSPDIGVMPRPSRIARPDVLLRLLEAMRKHKALKVVYQSMWTPHPEERVLAPHALAHDGMRWHVRAYCSLRKKFLDFQLGRFLEVSPSDAPGSDGTDDSAWHRLVPLVLAPHPALSPEQQHAIALDYGMVEGSTTLQCRQSMLFYTLRSLRLLKEGVEPPQDQQITLRNRVDIAELLPQDAAKR